MEARKVPKVPSETCDEENGLDPTRSILCEKTPGHSGDHKFTVVDGTYYWRWAAKVR